MDQTIPDDTSQAPLQSHKGLAPSPALLLSDGTNKTRVRIQISQVSMPSNARHHCLEQADEPEQTSADRSRSSPSHNISSTNIQASPRRSYPIRTCPKKDQARHRSHHHQAAYLVSRSYRPCRAITAVRSHSGDLPLEGLNENPVVHCPLSDATAPARSKN